MKVEIYGGSEHGGHGGVCVKVKDAEERDEVQGGREGEETGEQA